MKTSFKQFIFLLICSIIIQTVQNQVMEIEFDIGGGPSKEIAALEALINDEMFSI